MEQQKYKVIAQDWIEADYDSEGPYITFERFTTQHISIEALKAYIDRVHEVTKDRGIFEKTESDGEPYEDEVDQATYDTLKNNKYKSGRVW